jgi:hypothetical protein
MEAARACTRVLIILGFVLTHFLVSKINRAMVGCTLNDYFCCLPQVNFHVLPFVRKEHTSATSVFWKALRFLELDIRHRASRY